MRRALATTVLLALCSVAHANAPKDPKRAKLLSGGLSAVAGVVTLGGFMLAPDSRPTNKPILYTGVGMLLVLPSTGEFYSGQYLTVGMGIRAAGTALAAWTLESQTKVVTCDDGSSSEQKCEGFKENAAPLLGVAAIMFIGGVWWDVLDAGDAAERYNRRHGFTIAPTAMPGPQGLTPGVLLGGSF